MTLLEAAKALDNKVWATPTPEVIQLYEAITETERRQRECKHGTDRERGHAMPYLTDFCPDCGADLREVKP